MKNKTFIISFMMLALTFVVSGCSLPGGTQNTPLAPAASNNNAENNIPADTSPVVPTPDSVSAVAPAPTVNPAPAAVSIQNFAFDPATLTVKKGTEVIWTNNDSAPHKIQSDSFSSKTLGQGTSFSFTFNEAGNFDYFCAIHPSMTGRIIVE